MKVALYTRTSTVEQDPGSQLARLREWAARDGHDVVLGAQDKASGRDVRRPGMERIMQLARGHHVALVAVVKVDRWARSVQHRSGSLAELHRLGVGFVAVDQGLRLAPGREEPTSGLILNVLSAVAEWERAIISEGT